MNGCGGSSAGPRDFGMPATDGLDAEATYRRFGPSERSNDPLIIAIRGVIVPSALDRDDGDRQPAEVPQRGHRKSLILHGIVMPQSRPPLGTEPLKRQVEIDVILYHHQVCRDRPWAQSL